VSDGDMGRVARYPQRLSPTRTGIVQSSPSGVHVIGSKGHSIFRAGAEMRALNNKASSMLRVQNSETHRSICVEKDFNSDTHSNGQLQRSACL
jgi:hypothetical protein